MWNNNSTRMGERDREREKEEKTTIFYSHSVRIDDEQARTPKWHGKYHTSMNKYTESSHASHAYQSAPNHD